MHNLAVLVSSYDKAKDLWEPFFLHLDKYFPELLESHKVYLLSNEELFTYKKVVNLHSFIEKGYSANVLEALNSIDSKYILYFQDDHFMSGPSDVARFYDLLSFVEHNDIKYLSLPFDQGLVMRYGLFLHSQNDHDIGVVERSNQFKWYCCLDVAIWDREFFINMLTEAPEDPWAFELRCSEQAVLNQIPLHYVLDDHPISIYNIMAKGKPNCRVLIEDYDKNRDIYDSLELHTLVFKDCLPPIDL